MFAPLIVTAVMALVPLAPAPPAPPDPCVHADCNNPGGDLPLIGNPPTRVPPSHPPLPKGW
jgi:hypothetical protein